MSDDRLFHRRLGHSAKVNALTAIEEIVWRTYIQAADDFGVMSFAATELRHEHDRLAKRTDLVVQRMFERVRDVGLVHTFEHQGRIYCFQADWQEFQKVRYPFRTIHPRIPAALLRECTVATQWLHTVWPGGGRDSKLPNWMPPKGWLPPEWPTTPSSGSGSGTVPERVQNGSGPRVRGRVARAFHAHTHAHVPIQAHVQTEVLAAAGMQLVPPIRIEGSVNTNLPPQEPRRDSLPVENPDEPKTAAGGPPADAISATLRDRDGDSDRHASDRGVRVGGADQASGDRVGLHLPAGSGGDHTGDAADGEGVGAAPRPASVARQDGGTTIAAAADIGPADPSRSDASTQPGAQCLLDTIAELRARFATTELPRVERPGRRWHGADRPGDGNTGADRAVAPGAGAGDTSAEAAALGPAVAGARR